VIAAADPPRHKPGMFRLGLNPSALVRPPLGLAGRVQHRFAGARERYSQCP